MTSPGYLRHGWLPAVLPAKATRLRVADPAVAYTLGAAGAQLVDRDADVEIGLLDEITGEAPTAIVSVESCVSGSRGRARRMAARIAESVDVRLRAREAAAALKRRGFAHRQIVYWDPDQAIRIQHSRQQRLTEAFPRHALIVARREPPGPTVLDRAIADAERRTGARLAIVRPIVGSGTLVVLLESQVLRIAIGPARELIDRQADALVALHARNPDEWVASRVPGLLATGSAGLADWSLERRVVGVQPPWILTAPLLDRALDFLIALFHLGAPGTAAFFAPRMTRLASAGFERFPRGVFAALCDRAAQIDEDMRDVPRAFLHGDFSTQNVLVRGDRLTGVIDWAQADPSGLPLLDVLNLELLNGTQPDIYQWGPAIVSYLLPLARRGGGAATRRYAKAVGLDLSARQLQGLVEAYWLDRIGHQLATYLDRWTDALWLERNVTGVLPAIETVHR